MTIAAVIVAAGRGSRSGQELPKQYCRLGGRTVLARTLEAFAAHPSVARIVTVIHPDDLSLYEGCVRELDAAPEKLHPPVSGGATRQVSVRAGLEALSVAPPSTVLVHDAARPFVCATLIDRAIAAAARGPAAVPGTAVTDTIKVVDGAGRVTATPAREGLRAVQTPQSFSYEALRSAHERAAGAGLAAFTDDGALAEWAGIAVEVFEGDPENVKLTHPQDFAAAEQRLAGDRPMTVRLATGFDVHAFTEGDHVWLGGLKLPAKKGVVAHSDGDVALHALTDALLGVISDGDIGTHFPPSDPQWRGASSDRFLAFAAQRVRSKGGIIDHADLTILAEMPKIGPHRDAIRARIADILGISVGAVSIKATTAEKLGFVGRGEGLAAQAAVTVRLPAGT